MSSYRIQRFGSVTLPATEVDVDAGTAPSLDTIISTIGSYHDTSGTDQAKRKLPYKLVYRCTLMGATLAVMRTSWDALRALRGQQGNLYRRATDDNSVQYCVARLEQITARHKPNNTFYQPIELIFTIETAWRGPHYGSGWLLDSGEYLDAGLYLDEDDIWTMTASPYTVNVVNTGNAAITNAVLTVAAVGASITSLNVVIAGVCDWTYTGTIWAGTSLVMNCGALSLLNGGADAYTTSFTLNAGHLAEEWLRFAANATTSMVLTFVGGAANSTVSLDRWDPWE